MSQLCTIPRCTQFAVVSGLYTHKLIRCWNHKQSDDIQIVNGISIIWNGTRWLLKCEHETCILPASFGNCDIERRCALHRLHDDIEYNYNSTTYDKILYQSALIIYKMQHTTTKDQVSHDQIPPQCHYKDCWGTALYGDQILRQRTWCKIHRQNDDICLKTVCIYPNCTKRAGFGPNKKRIRCKLHSLDTDMNNIQKRCEYPKCEKIAIFGPNAHTIRCEIHCLNTDTKTKILCKHPECYIYSTFGPNGKKYRCKLHRLETDIHYKKRKNNDNDDPNPKRFKYSL